MFVDLKSNHTRVAYFNLPHDNWYAVSDAHEGHPAWGAGEGLFALEDGQWCPVSLRTHTRIGTYPIAYALQGHCLCSECAEESFKDEERPDVEPFINWEDACLHCYDCDARIESAYAEDSV